MRKIIFALILVFCLTALCFAAVTENDLAELNRLRNEDYAAFEVINNSKLRVQRLFRFYFDGQVSGIVLTAEQKQALRQEVFRFSTFNSGGELEN